MCSSCAGRAPSRAVVIQIGDEVIIRGKVVEHFGDDLMVRFEDPRGATTFQVGARYVSAAPKGATDESSIPSSKRSRSAPPPCEALR